METRERRYWFPAKRRGWGCGLPTAWQGKAVLAVYFTLAISGAFAFLPTHGKADFLAYIALLTAILLGVCWLKGEPPRWRWENE